MRCAAVLVGALVLAGCVSVKSFRSGTGAVYPAVRDTSVLVFFSVDDVKRPYDVIGEILAEGSSGWFVDENDVVDAVRKKAAELGAHGVIITREKGASATAAQLLGASDQKQRAQAIRFTDTP